MRPWLDQQEEEKLALLVRLPDRSHGGWAAEARKAPRQPLTTCLELSRIRTRLTWFTSQTACGWGVGASYCHIWEQEFCVSLLFFDLIAQARWARVTKLFSVSKAYKGFDSVPIKWCAWSGLAKKKDTRAEQTELRACDARPKGNERATVWQCARERSKRRLWDVFVAKG